MIKRISLLIGLVCLPTILLAQLDNDGKTEVGSVVAPDNDLRFNTILISSATNAPFGLKYQYCKNWGGYVSFKTDLGHSFHFNNFNLLTVGVSKSVGKKACLYLGGGLNLVGNNSADSMSVIIDNSGFTLETGIVFKIKKLAFEFGVSSSLIGLREEDVYIQPNAITLALILGIGYNF